MVEQTEVDLTQVASQHAQLEGMVEETNQVVHTIKQLLERMVIPTTKLTLRLRFAVEGSRVEHQVAKFTMHGNATSTRRANSSQVSRS